MGIQQENNGKIHHFQWENPLFLWDILSIAMLNYQRVTGVISLVLYHDLLLVGGFKHVLFHILGIIIPNDLLFHSYLVK